MGVCSPRWLTQFRRDCRLIPNSTASPRHYTWQVVYGVFSDSHRLHHHSVSTASNMHRLAFVRTAVAARIVANARAPTISPRIAFQLRHGSTKPSDERKQVLEARDDLQRDWDAKVITYEELKPKTEQPSPVRWRSHSTVLRLSHQVLGQVLDRCPRARRGSTRLNTFRGQPPAFSHLKCIPPPCC